MHPFYVPDFRLATCKNTHSTESFKAYNKAEFYGREQGNVYEPVRFQWAKMFIVILSQGINMRSDNYLWSAGLEAVSTYRCFFNSLIGMGCTFVSQF